MAETNARVTLKRLPRPLGDVLRTYNVVIDGNVVGAIRRRETKTFELASKSLARDGGGVTPDLPPGAPTDAEMLAADHNESRPSARLVAPATRMIASSSNSNPLPVSRANSLLPIA